MTQRSILAGTNPTVIIKAGANVTVKGYESDMATAETDGKWGLQVEKRSASEIGRARAVIGERVLFDVRLKLPPLPLGEGRGEGKSPEDVIEIQLGGSGEVLVPFGSNLKVYAGKDIDIQNIKGRADAYAGLNLKLQNVFGLGHVSAGWSMDIDCQTMEENNVEFKCGRDLRFHVRDLTSAHIRVRDIGGYWEAQIGNGEKSVSLKCGGDVTLVTDQKVEAMPPDYILGTIEKPTTV